MIGAGIVGLATARELTRRHPGIRIAVLEREPRIAAHQTGHSSGVIHAGVYYEPGSLRARLCVAGAAELFSFCELHAIPVQRTGKLIVASSADQRGKLDELERRGDENGVAGLTRVGAEGIAAIEPFAEGLDALYSPNTAVTDFTAVAAAMAADVAAAGGDISCGCEVEAIDEASDSITVRHSAGTTTATALVACAGAWSDRVAALAGAAREPRIVPFRGAYLRLRPERAYLVRGNIYPTPDPELPFLGAHLTRGIDGTVLLGPTALMVAARDAYHLRRVVPRDLIETLGNRATWRLLGRHWRAARVEVWHAINRRALIADAARIVPALGPRDFVPGPAGIRAQALADDGRLVDDFVTSATGRSVHVRNAPSPAATSSLPLARLIADQVGPLLG